MSRGYRIAVPLQVARGTVSGSDELCVDLDILPILADAQMRELVREALKEKGFRPQADGSMEKPLDGGAVARLEADGKTVTVRLETRQEVQGAGTTAQEAKAALAARQTSAAEAARRAATSQVARAEPAVRSELDEVVQKVYLEALKLKAAQMGQVESVQETRSADGSMEITIKVKA